MKRIVFTLLTLLLCLSLAGCGDKTPSQTHEAASGAPPRPEDCSLEFWITDPAVTLYGLTVESPLDEWDAVFQEMGYNVRWDGQRHHAEKDGFHFSYGGGEICISAEVTNEQGIVF